MILTGQCFQLSFDVDGFARQAGGDQRGREFGARHAGKFEQTPFVFRQMIYLMGDHLTRSVGALPWEIAIRDDRRHAPSVSTIAR